MKRGKGFSKSIVKPKPIIHAGLRKAQFESLRAYNDNPLSHRAINKVVSDSIGGSVRMLPASSDHKLNDSLRALWDKHERFIDVSGDQSFHGLLSTIIRERQIKGEVFVRLIKRKLGLYPAPMQVQIIPSEMVPLHDQVIDDKRRIVQGVEFYEARKVAVWFKKDHQDMYPSIRVPFREVCHCFLKEHSNQVRGTPVTTTSLNKENQLEDYLLNEQDRRKALASIIGALQVSPDEERKGLTEDEEKEEDLSPHVQVNGASLYRTREDEVVNFFNSGDIGQGVKDFTNLTHSSISMGYNMPAQLVTDNYEGMSDRVLRSVTNTHRRHLRNELSQVIEFQVAGKIWRWFVDAAVLSGVSVTNYQSNRDDCRKVKFIPEAFAYDHPVQDIQAVIKQVESGFLSPVEYVESRGGNPELIKKHIKQFNKDKHVS